MASVGRCPQIHYSGSQRGFEALASRFVPNEKIGLPESAQFWQDYRRSTRSGANVASLLTTACHCDFKPQPKLIMRKIGTIRDRDTGRDLDIMEQADGSVTFSAGATLDGDGASGQFGGPPCYAPASLDGKTLDILANAGGPGNWYGVVTDKSGRPIIQGPDDPCPGAYVSATTLHLLGKKGKQLPDSSPFKYVDSATVPFIVVPPMIVKGVAGIVMGCRCVVANTRNGRSVEGVVADGGPRNHLGEISVACAKAIGVPTGETHPANGGGASAPAIKYQLFPGTPAVVKGVTYPLQRSASTKQVRHAPRAAAVAALARKRPGRPSKEPSA